MTIHLQVGALPWLGSARAELVEELSTYDLPLVNLVELDGRILLSRCIIGEVEPVNVWTYTPLSPDQVAAIDAADHLNFDEVVNPIAAGSTHVAVSFDGDGIVAWTEWNDWPTPQAAVNELAKRIASHLEARRAELDGLTAGAASAQTQAERLLELAG